MLPELSRTVFEPYCHDSGEVSGPVAIRFLSHQQQAAATLCRRFGGGARGVLGARRASKRAPSLMECCLGTCW